MIYLHDSNATTPNDSTFLEDLQKGQAHYMLCNNSKRFLADLIHGLHLQMYYKHHKSNHEYEHETCCMKLF